jgi:diguanylate cyclase (GGDEF)-like protein
MSATAAGGQLGAAAGGIELHSTSVPRQLRLLEPFACLALAAHGFAVQLVAAERAVPPMLAAVAILAVAGGAGLLGWRAPWAVVARLGVILALGFVLMALGEEGSGYILLWYFVVVAVYPLVLPQGPSRWVAVVVPVVYLCLVPLDAADGPLPVAALRAVALGVIAVFVHSAATAFRAAVADRDAALVTLYTFAEATPVGLGYWDRALRAQWLNTALAELSDLSASEHVGRSVTETLGFSPVIALNLLRVLATGRSVSDVELTAEGRVWTSSYFPVRNGARLLGVGAVVIDVTEQREAARALTHSATHDALTGLPNRALFSDRLEVALAQAERTGALVAVLFCDVDRFKLVNDSLGHAAGDALLQTAGERLADVVRQGDTVARLGGDEFALLCTEVADIAEARAVGERVCAVLREPIQVGERRLTSTMSVGVAVGTPGEREVEDLLRDADVAMYQAKDSGRDQVAVFDARLRNSANERFELHSDLREAIAAGDITVAYQPVVRLGNHNGDGTLGAITGMEALARWRRPGHGNVPPVSFIPMAEDLGLIHALGEHVLRTACGAVADWRAETGRPLVVAVNMSALQLADHGCVDMVARVLDEVGLPPAALELEITESVLMLDVEQSLSRLAELRALGVSVAVDDFGTGYSSLAYLRDLPVDVLKIDRSFTSRLPDDQPMFAFIVELARAIGAVTVVEGVETDEELRLVTELGCDMAQGFYLSRPLTPDAFGRFLRAGPGA